MEIKNERSLFLQFFLFILKQSFGKLEIKTEKCNFLYFWFLRYMSMINCKIHKEAVYKYKKCTYKW